MYHHASKTCRRPLPNQFARPPFGERHEQKYEAATITEFHMQVPRSCDTDVMQNAYRVRELVPTATSTPWTRPTRSKDEEEEEEAENPTRSIDRRKIIIVGIASIAFLAFLVL